jgi:hypothetical protein
MVRVVTTALSPAWNYWVSGLFSSSGILNNRKQYEIFHGVTSQKKAFLIENNISETGSVFVLS